MTLFRSLAIISASLLILNGCGGKKETTPEQSAQTANESSTEELFDEFYDSSDDTGAEESYADNVDDVIDDDVVEEIIDEIPTPSFSQDGRYVVQISCVASEAIAEDVARKLENSGYPVYVAEVQNPTPQLLGTYFRIRIGGFDNLTDAKNFGEDHLIPTGFEYWLDNRSNDNLGIGDFGLGENASFETVSDQSAPTNEQTPSYSDQPTSSDDFVVDPVDNKTADNAGTIDETVKTADETVKTAETATDETVKTVETATDEAVKTVETTTDETVTRVDETVKTAAPVFETAQTVIDTVKTASDDEWGTSDW